MAADALSARARPPGPTPRVARPSGWITVVGDGRGVPDLLWTVAPLTGGDDVADGQPIVGLDWWEAAAVAASVGGRLPTSEEWTWMAAGLQARRYPWGEEPWTPPRANLRASGLGEPTLVHAHPAGATPQGIVDVAGNVWEWTASMERRGVVIRGGSYQSIPQYARSSYAGNTVPPSLRSPGIGVRAVRDR